MKKSILLAVLTATGVILSSCVTEEPQPVYHRHYNSEKTPPSVQSGRAEDFRAIEKPSTYSE